MNRGRPIAIAQNATDGDDDNVAEEVFAIARMPRIGERLKERTNRFDIDELRHGNILEIEANRRARTCRAQRSPSPQRYGAPTQGARPLSCPIMRAGLGEEPPPQFSPREQPCEILAGRRHQERQSELRKWTPTAILRPPSIKKHVESHALDAV